MRDLFNWKKSIKWNIWILVVLITMVLLATWGTLAAYVSRSYVKGVATTPKQSFVLSSDYLSAVSKSADPATYPDKKIVLTEKGEDDTKPYTFTFSITNRADGFASTKKMQYYLKMSGLPEGATVRYGNEDITSKVTSESGYNAPAMYSHTSVTHTYQVSIPQDKMTSAADITVTATPDNDSDTSGLMLAARLQPSFIGTVAAFLPEGVILEKQDIKYNADEYAAFNYQISVSNAAGSHNMKLTWNNELIEIDPLFLDTISDSSYTIDPEKKITTLVFPMDDTNSNYLVQFYRLGKSIDSWGDLGLTFTEAQNQGEGNPQ